MKNTKFLTVLLAVLGLLLAGCMPQEIEVTRQVEVELEVEVTREVEVEVTRVVEVVTEPPLTYTLTVMHTSENHGHWEPFTPLRQPTQGGIAKRAVLVDQIRAEAANSLLLDSGDVAQGTLFFTLYGGVAARDFYNQLGYDAVTLGNHEFDLGPEALAANFVNDAEFAVLSAIVDVSDEPALAGSIDAYVILEVGGEPIGLIGVMHNHLASSSSPGPNVLNTDPGPAVEKAVSELTAQGVNKIIVISHIGFEGDLELAGAVDGIDVIVSGHTATLLGDADVLPEFLGPPDGSYPTIVDQSDGVPTLAVCRRAT